jgi:hypothetical protein
VQNPQGFGTLNAGKACIPRNPDGSFKGDRVSMLVALNQHHLALAYNMKDRKKRLSGRAWAEQFGFSRQLWSEIIRGEVWANQIGLATLVVASKTRAS